MDEYILLINRLESEGKLDRELEFIPSDEVLQARKASGEGLTRPELSVLISYTKGELKEKLNVSSITQDEYLSRAILTAFPQRLVNDFGQEIEDHRLRGEIIATQVANNMVNSMGITFTERLCQISGASLADVAAAFVIARDVFGIDQLWEEIEALDNQVTSALQQQMMADLIRLIRRATYWFLRHQRPKIDVTAAVSQFRPGSLQISKQLSDLLKGEPRARWQQRHDDLVTAGVPSSLAAVVAGADNLYSLLSIIQATEQTGQSLERVAQIHFALGDNLELHWFDHQIKEIDTNSHWESMSRDGFREDLTNHQQAITVNVLQSGTDEEEGDALVKQWLQNRHQLMQRWQHLLGEIRSSSQPNSAIFAVAIRELQELAQAR